jgi:flagellar hook-associated protein 3 FlgL
MTMRVSNQMQFSLSIDTVNRRRSELIRIQEQIATGRRINSFAEDPVASRKILREQGTLRRTESWARSAGQAQVLLETSDSVLVSVEDALGRAYELTIQMANDSYSASDRQSAADEIEQIRERVVELANSERNGRYLFSGLGNVAQPFLLDGTFQGDTDRLSVPVGRRASLDATVGGGEPFLDQTGGRNTVETLIELEDALRASDSTRISNLVDEVEGARDRATDARQQIGQRLQRLDNIRDALDRAEVAANATLVQERDTDVADAIVKLRESETGLQAALSITGRLDDLSLLNYMR